MAFVERRKYKRHLVETGIKVNYGHPDHCGTLYDLSYGGGSIMYPQDAVRAQQPVVVGQSMMLEFTGGNDVPVIVIRTFEGGFAVKFDLWVSLNGAACVTRLFTSVVDQPSVMI